MVKLAEIAFAALTSAAMIILPARAAEQTAAASPGQAYSLACPPDFLTDTEQRMFAKEGTIRSGPWHVKCFQNGTPIYDRDRLYVFCGRGDTHAGLEGADGRAIRFQFPSEVACIWER